MERILTTSEQHPEFGEAIEPGMLLRSMQCARRIALASMLDPFASPGEIKRATRAHEDISHAITEWLSGL